MPMPTPMPTPKRSNVPTPQALSDSPGGRKWSAAAAYHGVNESKKLVKVRTHLMRQLARNV